VKEFAKILRAYFSRCDNFDSICAVYGVSFPSGTKKCEQIGSHCIYIGDECKSRNFYDFQGGDAETPCRARASHGDCTCIQNRALDRCENANEPEFRQTPSETPMMKPESLSPTTLAPTGKPKMKAPMPDMTFCECAWNRMVAEQESMD